MGFLEKIEKDLKNLTKWLTGDKPVSKKKAVTKKVKKTKKRKIKKQEIYHGEKSNKKSC